MPHAESPRRRTTLCKLPSLLAAIVFALASAGAALAHGPEPKPVRELVRIQGHRDKAPPASDPVVLTAQLKVLGETLTFYATTWQRFSFADKATDAAAEGRSSFTLQGSRPLLMKVSKAREDQRMTLLAESHPRSSDLFLISVDLCPRD